MHLKGADSMAVSGLSFRNALVGSGWATAVLLCMNWLRKHMGIGAGQVGPVLTGPLFHRKLVGITIITITTCVLVRAAAACSASG